MISRVSLACLAMIWAMPLEAAVQLGSDVLAINGFRELRGKRVGLLTNPSGVNRQLETTVSVLRRAEGVKLVALFAAEHGLAGAIPAGIEFTNSSDARTGLPIHSLYGPGPVRKPTPQMLKGLDALVYDIQDTGCRSYTFISSMGLAMEACAENGVEFVVLDRPNPLGGNRIEGPILDLKFKSMIGQWPIPYVYGLTCGELARMINGERWIKKPCRLTVVPMAGWRRSMAWRDTGLLWVPTSPYIAHADAPLHYVSTGILGQIGGVSIGIGYTLPFQCIAAPWLDNHRLAENLNSRKLSGIKFLPVSYQPFYGAFQGRTNLGVQVYFLDPARAPLMSVNLVALEAVRQVSGRDLFKEALKSGRNLDLFDKVMGTDTVRKQLTDGSSAATISASWKAGEEGFRQRRMPYLLYLSNP
jgi:uncharacterized protein YbbC (DUF1343 family)